MYSMDCGTAWESSLADFVAAGWHGNLLATVWSFCTGYIRGFKTMGHDPICLGQGPFCDLKKPRPPDHTRLTIVNKPQQKTFFYQSLIKYVFRMQYLLKIQQKSTFQQQKKKKSVNLRCAVSKITQTLINSVKLNKLIPLTSFGKLTFVSVLGRVRF